MRAFRDQDEFAAASPAAAVVLRHRENDREVKDGPWRFDHGKVSTQGPSKA